MARSLKLFEPSSDKSRIDTLKRAAPHARMFGAASVNGSRTEFACDLSDGVRVFRTPRKASYEQHADPSDEDFAAPASERHNSALNFSIIFFSALETVICDTPSSLAISACDLFSKNLCLNIYLFVSLSESSTLDTISAISILA